MESFTQCSNQAIGPANQLFTVLMQTLLAAQCAIAPPDMWPPDYGPTAHQQGLGEYDFIIVGAGSAGAVMANRLSENPDWKVLLLEAGGDPPIESEIPGLVFTLPGTASDWQYNAQPCANASLAMRNGQTYWARGKMLGGSSSLNVMIYVRGNRRDFDGWSDNGMAGWDWDSVLPYFKKFEDNRDPRIAADTRNHATGGLLKVGRFGFDGAVRKLLVAGWAELGFRELVDFNGDEHLGFGDVQGTVDNGVRTSTAKAFLNTAKERRNLHIIKYAHATELLWAPSSAVKPRVEGVRFRMDDKIYEARIRKEVIVSAGSVNTPQLLMLSGIGPKQQLAQHDILQRVNLPVGQRMQDHLIVPLLMRFHESTALPLDMRPPDEAAYEFLMHRTGRLSNIGVTAFTTFASTVNDPKYPNVQFHQFFFPRGHPDLRVLIHGFGYDAHIVDAFGVANDRADIVFWVMLLLNPKSTGSVRLNETAPKQAPLIHPNYFSDAGDIAVAVDGMRILRNLTRTRAFAAHEGEYVRMPLAACDAHADDSDAYWECYVRHMTSTLNHPVGTARMGPDDDGEAVVDGALRVRGVQGLRVVDASVMPEIVSGNTNAATIMIGEKGADLVKKDWLTETEWSREEL